MRLLHLLLLTLLVGCGKLEFISSESLDSDPHSDVLDTLNYVNDYLGYEYDSLAYVMSNDVLERAYQMATLVWTPKNPIPQNGGGYYAKGRTVKGVPYSSVKEINTYLFQDVSYHTFMTAVHNPRSVLYTEDISKSPYYGRNCAPYYGAVCSSSVMHAFGIDIPYYANQIIKLPCMAKLEYQVIDSLKVCDVIWKSGHVQMIFDVEFRADTLYRISTFESSGKSAHIMKYSKENFRKMWESSKYVGYRFKNLIYSEEFAEFRGLDPVTYNDDLCPSKGDRAVYRTTDTVTVDIFNPNYDRIVLKRDTMEIAFNDYEGEIHKYFDLTPGVYTAFLQKGEEKSADVSFEIIETEVSCSNSGGDISIHFHSSAEPVYVALCDIAGDSYCYYPISSVDRERGFILVPRMDRSEYYCKIVFKGEYGRIINEPIRVF